MTPLLFALALAAQTSDSVRQSRYERVLNSANDSLGRLRGVIAVFRTDLPSASRELVLVRAERVRVMCHGADAAVIEVQSLLSEGLYSRRAEREQSQLQKGSIEMRRVFARCAREWETPDPPVAAAADSLQAWGPYRTAQLEAAVRRFAEQLRHFMNKTGLKTPPPR